MFLEGNSARVCRQAVLFLLLITAVLSAPVSAQETDKAAVDRVLDAVVAIQSQIRTDARTRESLGERRLGSGVIIDANGLVLTIGYLILEAESVIVFTREGKQSGASVLAYDHDTGLGLLRTDTALDVEPLRFGDSTALERGVPVLAIAFGGKDAVQPAVVMSRREFAGFWEYLLPNAIFTAPPHPAQAGAALVDVQGKLLGVGSLTVPNSLVDSFSPGNMFVPIEAFEPVLGAMLARDVNAASSRPWIGVYTRQEGPRLVVQRLAEQGPALLAGLKPGDAILKVGAASIDTMASFYREIWALGDAGVTVPLTVERNNSALDIEIRSASRYDWLKLDD